MEELVIEIINSKIYTIRGEKVMLDRDLAQFYDVDTKVLNQAVKRNIERFPEDFMFQLSKEEFDDWRSQFVTSKNDKIGLRRAPYAFSEHGILMLSSVLRSKTAIEVNIQIMRTFAALRRYALTYDELAKKIEQIESRVREGKKLIIGLLRF
ncbi:KilA-N, DNA-binding domain protein [Arcobacter nitrofigilis DSM 7299]|uniref:KilA-N, DNA-binding domain protein n=1 Tax=Arcobacter nitrofigilis (strain ATCC 33309 / DSM 7299 / CCUG 15893 / LMG 7604 / NCTC 12251 / CI) TaxID=572480 RepID=D5V3Y1_ARCNC|nr:ORF6N domain-containing protein [Arcobacter nitrofigilis]ADG92809.1 KilA-N, DNA-binding domain protein [Arcobacter nitrofigilis DSM 7299]